MKNQTESMKVSEVKKPSCGQDGAMDFKFKAPQQGGAGLLKVACQAGPGLEEGRKEEHGEDHGLVLHLVTKEDCVCHGKVRDAEV